VLWVVRFALKWAGVRSEIWDWALGIGLASTIAAMCYFIVRMDSWMERE
jgi:hypothetical protein